MTEFAFHGWLVWGMIGLAVVTFVALQFISAPYGRHTRKGWGPELPSRWGWIIMESPPVLCFLWFFSWGAHRGELVPLVLLAMWLWHYLHRAYIYPFRMQIKDKKMPVVVAGLAILFNVPNAYINARWIGGFGTYSESWLMDPRFIAGVLIFAVGFAINWQSDAILFRLRKPGESGYKIPQGGLYRWVSCPNYFGEILEWTGWAVATWSLSGLAFALFTIANLAPRAISNHRWYQHQFPEYPKERKALVPFVV